MKPSAGSTDNANVIAPAPVFYGVSFIVALIFNYFYPIAVLANSYAFKVGILFVVISIAIVLSAVFALRKSGTTFDARKTSTALVTNGIFRLSRNPTYLSLTLLFTGIALILNSLPALISVGFATLLVHFGVIKREEHYLAAKFGDSYSQYKQKVRRWI